MTRDRCQTWEPPDARAVVVLPVGKRHPSPAPKLAPRARAVPVGKWEAGAVQGSSPSPTPARLRARRPQPGGRVPGLRSAGHLGASAPPLRPELHRLLPGPLRDRELG